MTFRPDSVWLETLTAKYNADTLSCTDKSYYVLSDKDNQLSYWNWWGDRQKTAARTTQIFRASDTVNWEKGRRGPSLRTNSSRSKC